MKVSITILVLHLLCASAKPAPCSTSSSSCKTVTKSCTSTKYCFFQNFYESKYECSFVDVNTCSSIGITTLYDSIPKLIIEDLEREYLQAKCNILEKYSVFPINLASTIHKLKEEELLFEYVILGSSPSALLTLEKLANKGHRCLLIDSGLLPPTYSDSLYMKMAMLSSQYVKPYVSSCGKKYFSSNVLGGYSIYGLDLFDYGSEYYYQQLSKLDSRFSWEDAQTYYKSFSTQKTTTKETKTEVKQSSCGGFSISTSVRETSVTRSFGKVFTEMGYGESAPLTCGCNPGFYSVPRMVSSDSETDSLLPYIIFKNIKCHDNIRILTGYEIEKLIYESGRICGVQINSPHGPIVIKQKMEFIFGMDSIDLTKLFYKSGFGSTSVLSSLGLPCIHPIEYLGKSIMFSPIYTGSYMKVKRGTFIQEFENDCSYYSSFFGSTSMSASSYQASYSAYLSVGGCKHSNVKLQFYSFNYYQKKMLEVYLRNYAQYSEEVCQHFLDLICEYDIVFFVTQLLEFQSKGSLIFKESIEKPVIDFGFYKVEQDMQYMIEAIKLSQKIGMTKVIQGYNGEVCQVPISSCTSSPFSDEYIRESLTHFTIPSYNNFGAFSFGSDVASSVLDINFRPHNLGGAIVIGPGTISLPWFSDSIALSSYFSHFIYNNIISVSSSSSSTSISTSSGSAVTRELEVKESSTTNVIGGGPIKPGCGCDDIGIPDCGKKLPGIDCDDIDVIPDCGEKFPGIDCDDIDVIPNCGKKLPGFDCDDIDVVPGCGSSFGSAATRELEINESSTSQVIGGGPIKPGCGGNDIIIPDCDNNLSEIGIGSGLSSTLYEAKEFEKETSSIDSSSYAGGIASSATSEFEQQSASYDSSRSIAGVGSSDVSYDSEYVSAANESSQVIAGANGIASQYSNSEYAAESSDFEKTVHGPCGVSKVEQESKSVSSSTVEATNIVAPCTC